MAAPASRRRPLFSGATLETVVQGSTGFKGACCDFVLLRAGVNNVAKGAEPFAAWCLIRGCHGALPMGYCARGPSLYTFLTNTSAAVLTTK